MTTLTDYDWRKAAAQQAMPDDQVEKAFFEQAQQFIQNKAAPIMRDPYRLGFEIVEKNDDNTRMVGIFAFRIDRGLFYAPAFFLNGEIKGTDLFYNHTEKEFKPLTEGWIKFYLERDKQEQGEGMSRAERRKHPHDLQLRRLAIPPFTHNYGLKYASSSYRKKTAYDTGGSTLSPDEKNLILYAGTNRQPYSKEHQPWFLHGLEPELAATATYGGDAENGYGAELSVPMETAKKHQILKALIAEAVKEHEETKRQISGFTAKPARFVWVSPDFVDIDADDLAKAASEKDPLMEQFLNEDWSVLLPEMAKAAALRPLMKQFLLEDGGWDAFDKIAHAIEHLPGFAERLCAHTRPEDFSPEELLQRHKQASAPELELIVGLVDGLDKTASAEVFKKGYVFIDKRAEEKITPVYADNSNDMFMETVSEPGVYKVLLVGGEEVEAFCAPESPERPCADVSCDNKAVIDMSVGGAGYMGYQEPNHPKTVVVTDDGRTCCARLVFGKMVATEHDYLKKESDRLKKEMTPGNVYRIFDSKMGVLSDTIYCMEKSEKNGLTVYSIVPGNYEPLADLKVNPDYDGCSIADGVVGNTGFFIKVNGELRDNNGPEASSFPSYCFDYKRCSPGDSDNIRQWIQDAGMKKASLTHANGFFTYQMDGGQASPQLDLVQMIAGLASEMEIKVAAAEELVLEAQDKGKVGFWMDTSSKSAGVIRRMAEPRFQTMSDPGFGVEVDTPQRFVLPTRTEQEYPPEHHIGDAYDPSLGAGEVPERNSPDAAPIEMLMSGTPEQLAQFSQQDSVPHMFEHGVIGTLVDTYDSSSMIDKYLPDLEQGLDRAGRILFLFYWKPGDYQDLYGTDDMTNLENKLLSNFKSWGDMVLDLLQKTKTKQRGNVPLTGASA